MVPMPPRRRPEILTDGLPDGSTVLYDPREEMVYAISATGAHVWDACDGSRELTELAELLAATFETDPDTVRPEIASFITHLETLDLLEPRPHAGA